MKFILRFWNETKPILIIFLLWRIWLFLIGILSFNFLEFKASFPYIDQVLVLSRLPQWLWHWGNFDGVHYLSIAALGYREGDQVFFPLFPLGIRLLNLVIGNYVLSGLLLANFAALFSGIVFYLLVKRDFDKTTALWSVVFLFSFPTSFFMGAVYTEGLFLLLTVLAFYFQGLKSALFSILAGMTRLVGALIPPFFGLIGLALYVLYLQINFSKPLYFLTAQADFQNNRASDLFGLVTPFQVIYRYFKIFFTVDSSQYSFWVAAVEFSALVLGVSVLGYLTFRKIVSWRYLIFSWLALLLPIVSGTLSSVPRYLLTIFPIYIFFGRIKNKVCRIMVLIVSLIFQVILTVLFVRGYFVA